MLSFGGMCVALEVGRGWVGEARKEWEKRKDSGHVRGGGFLCLGVFPILLGHVLETSLGDSTALVSADATALVLGHGTRLGHALGVGVQLQHGRHVLQGVLLLGERAALPVDGHRAQTALHLIRVDDTGQIGVRHGGLGQLVVLLQASSRLGGTEKGIQLLEGGLGPDDEATQMTTRGQLEKVQAIHTAQIDASNVPAE